MAQPLPALLVESFAGGINTSTSPANIADNELEDALNMNMNLDGSLSTRGGIQQYNPTLTGSGRVTSLYYTKKTDLSASLLIATTAQKIWKDNGSGGWTDITGSTVPPNDTLWMWRTFGNLAIGVNGTSVPQKNTYSGVCADLSGSPPDKCKLIETFRGRVLLAGDQDEPTALHGSAAGNAENWTAPSDAFTIFVDRDNGQPITAIVKFFEVLIIFKRKGVYRLENPDNVPANFQILQIFDDIGCVSPYSVKQIGNELVFADDDGIYSLRATQESGDVAYVAVTKKVQTHMDDTAFQFMNQCYATDIRELNQYRISLPKSTSTVNNHVLVRDYFHGGWLRHEGVNFACYGTAEISNRIEFLAGGYNGKVYKLETTDADDSAAYMKQVKTKRYTFTSLARKHFIRSYVEYSTDSTYALGFTAVVDEVISKGVSLTNTDSGSLWDVGLWDVMTWAGARIGREWIQLGKKGKGIQFQFLNSLASQPYSLFKLGLLATGLGRRG